MLERSHFDRGALNKLVELIRGTCASQALSKAVRQQWGFRAKANAFREFK